MITVFQFPGQGAAFAGMGRDLCASWPAARAVYDEAADLCGIDLLLLARDASPAQLHEPETSHLLIYVHSLAVCRVLALAGINPDLLAGHSLGHLAALCAAGAVGFGEGLELARRRGALLAECCRRHPGAMLAVRGLAPERVAAAIAPLGGQGVLCVAAVNGADDVVVAGEPDLVSDALRALRQVGGATTPLRTAGAFHSPLVAEAARAFGEQCAGVALAEPRRPVLSTADGAILATAAELRRDLAGHLARPVRWDRVLDTLLPPEPWIERWIEVGPGKMLTGLVRRRSRTAAALFTGTAAALAGLCGGRPAGLPGDRDGTQAGRHFGAGGDLCRGGRRPGLS